MIHSRISRIIYLERLEASNLEILAKPFQRNASLELFRLPGLLGGQQRIQTRRANQAQENWSSGVKWEMFWIELPNGIQDTNMMITKITLKGGKYFKSMHMHDMTHAAYVHALN